MMRSRTRRKGLRDLWKAIEVLVANHNQLVVNVNAHREHIIAQHQRIEKLEAAMAVVLRDEHRDSDRAC